MPQEFPHLPIPLRVTGRAYLTGGGRESEETKNNKLELRGQHGDYLTGRTKSIGQRWVENHKARAKENKPPVPPGIPMLLQVDDGVDIDYLRTKLGFEVVSEQEDGFVIVSTTEMHVDLFLEKIEGFVEGRRGTTTAACIHRIFDDNEQSRIARVLSEQMLALWPHILDANTYVVELGIECQGTIAVPELKLRENDSEERRAAKLDEWEALRRDAYEALDELKGQREDYLIRFVEEYGGKVLSLVDGEPSRFFDFPDSFTAKVSISGVGLKDLVLNYPHLFEVTETEKISTPLGQDGELLIEGQHLEILPPTEEDPSVCVIDSGIQEEHLLLAPAIAEGSFSWVPNDDEVGDLVRGGGHGTRVAGAVLYPRGIPRGGTYKLPCWIQNARVLDADCKLQNSVFPPVLLEQIVKQYHPNGTKIFNHSISSSAPCRTRHMSSWAAAIDQLSYQNDILFIQAAGNIPDRTIPGARLGILDHLAAGRAYPAFLRENSCRIPNPAQSLQALVVGSVSHCQHQTDFVASFAPGPDHPSAFSATGPGIWEVTKPDVVEYGGDSVYDTGNPPSISNPPEVCTELVRSTTQGGPALARDQVGTSFSAPRVAHIAAQLQKILPEEPALLYRALIAQSARWPDWVKQLSLEEQANVFRHFGYGIPDLERATSNTPFRATLITTDAIQIGAREAHVFEVPIPASMRDVTGEQDILVEITLSYVAKPRRTRRHLRGYLGTWLDWNVSKIGEDPKVFADRVLRDESGRLGEPGSHELIDWQLGSREDWGSIPGVKRGAGTLQKDWAIVKPYQLSKGFCVAVVGHPGWDNDIYSTARYSLAVTFESINQDLQIYQEIRTEVENYVSIELPQQRIQIEQLIPEA